VITPENWGVRDHETFIKTSLLRQDCALSAHGFDLKCSSTKLEQTPRKEVIHPHLPVGIPCYDFTPVTDHSLVSALPKVRLPTSGAIDSHGVTGGVYKARERIHRSVLISDY
jgi:hypothetical protein